MDGVLEIVCVLTGMVLVRLLSMGRWRGTKLTGNEASINSAAGSLSFFVDGKRVITAVGLMLVGMAFYGVLAAVAIFLAMRG